MKFLKSNKFTWLMLVLLAIVAIAPGFFFHSAEEEMGFWFTHIWGFFALLGFLGCLALILVAKWLGHWLQRKEDYYD